MHLKLKGSKTLKNNCNQGPEACTKKTVVTV